MQLLTNSRQLEEKSHEINVLKNKIQENEQKKQIKIDK